LPANNAWRVTIDPLVAGGRDLGEDLWVATDDTGEVHEFGNSDCPVLVEKFPQLGAGELGGRALEMRRRHAARGGDPEGEGEPARSLGQGDDARNAEDIGDLV